VSHLRQGSGLVDAAERTPIVAHIVQALARLRDLAQDAKGSRLNCMQLDAFGQDIMRAFDFHGVATAAYFKMFYSVIIRFGQGAFYWDRTWCKRRARPDGWPVDDFRTCAEHERHSA